MELTLGTIQQLLHFAAIGDEVGGLEEAGDDDDAARSGGEDGGEVFQLDAANAEDGSPSGFVDAADVVEADGGVIGLGRRGEERAEADVIRLGGASEGLGDGVGGFPDDGAGSGKLAGLGDGEVVLADVCAGGAGAFDEFGVVVEDEGNTGGLEKWDEFHRDLRERLGGEFFSAELHDIDAASDHLPGELPGLGDFDVTQV